MRNLEELRGPSIPGDYKTRGFYLKTDFFFFFNHGLWCFLSRNLQVFWNLSLISGYNLCSNKLTMALKLPWPRGPSIQQAGISVLWAVGEKQITKTRKVLMNPEGFAHKRRFICWNLVSFWVNINIQGFQSITRNRVARIASPFY